MKVLFFNLPAHGHVNPTLGLVRELVDRGEEVHYYCSAEFKDKIEAAGAVFHLLPFTLKEAYSRDFDLLGVLYDVYKNTEAALPELLAEVEKGGYDYIITDFMTIWGRFIGEIMPQKMVVTYLIFAMHPKIKQPRGFRKSVWKKPLRLIRTFIRLHLLIRRLSKKYNLPYFDLKRMFSGKPKTALGLVFTSKSFQPNPELFEEGEYKFIGSIIDHRNEQTSDFPMTLIDPLKPLLVISLGSILHNNLAFFKTCAAAFKDSDFQVVMSVGTHINIHDLDLSDNIIAWPYIPQLALLKKASVFITHGGMNSAVEGIMHEVPMLVLPQVSDQFLVARELEKNGVALWPAEKPTAAKLRIWTEKVFGNEEMYQNLAKLRQSFVEAGGSKHGAEAIQTFISL